MLYYQQEKSVLIVTLCTPERDIRRRKEKKASQLLTFWTAFSQKIYVMFVALNVT